MFKHLNDLGVRKCLVGLRSGGSPPIKWRKLAHFQREEAYHERESQHQLEEVQDGTTSFTDKRVDATPPNEWRKLTKEVQEETTSSLDKGEDEAYHQEESINIIQHMSKDTTITCRKSIIQWSKLNTEWIKSKKRLSVPLNKGV
ncbi:hypothetical protein ACLB2K_073955 [Fragaria x ananassa]